MQYVVLGTKGPFSAKFGLASDGANGQEDRGAFEAELMEDTSIVSLDEIYFETILKFARKGRLPLRSPCPNGCRFCYERNMNQMIPDSFLARMPVLTPEVFDFVLEHAKAAKRALDPNSSCMNLPDKRVMFFSFSDFFSQGLTAEQIEKLMAHNEQYPPNPHLYTNGLMLEPELAIRMSERYPSTFRLYVSVFTFDDEIKLRLVPRWPGSAKLLGILPHLVSAIVYLTNFSFEQTIADIETINAHANSAQRPTVVLSRLHYNKLHPPLIKELAEPGLADFPRLVEYLMAHSSDLTNIEGITFQHPSTAYAWRFRQFLKERLAALDLGSQDVVLSSRAARPVLERLLTGRGAEVYGVADPLGGSTDFATTVTTPNLIRRVQDLMANGKEMKRIVVPSSMWPWSGSCLAGGSVDDLRASFPGVEVSVVDIPFENLATTLTIRQVWDFYEAGGSDLLEEV